MVTDRISLCRDFVEGEAALVIVISIESSQVPPQDRSHQPATKFFNAWMLRLNQLFYSLS